MKILNLFKRTCYDMDTLDGIKAIPVPAKNYNTGNPTKDCIYYVLQRKATEHKKNGHMDLAIACLRKSNELSDHEKCPLLSQNEYLRLVKYIKQQDGDEAANQELKRIMAIHPEFADKRISNLARIKEVIQKNNEWGNDYVRLSTNRHCSICKNYHEKIFSISGKPTDYPRLPIEVSRDGGFCPNCTIGLSSFFPGISSIPKK